MASEAQIDVSMIGDWVIQNWQIFTQEMPDCFERRDSFLSSYREPRLLPLRQVAYTVLRMLFYYEKNIDDYMHSSLSNIATYKSGTKEAVDICFVSL